MPGLLDQSYIQQELLPQLRQEIAARKGLLDVPYPKEKPPVPSDVPRPKRKPKDIDPIARILISEAGGEGLTGMQAVANVIQNRVSEKGKGFGKQTTPFKVISAPGQFEGYKNEQYNIADKHPNWDLAKRIASQMLSGNLEDITGGATYYHNPRIDPGSKGQKFFPDMVKRGVFSRGQDIGLHRFYRQIKDR